MRKVSVLVGAEIGVAIGGGDSLHNDRICTPLELLRPATRYGD